MSEDITDTPLPSSPSSSSGVTPTSIAHLSGSVRLALSAVFGGSEAQRMTPEIAQHISVLNEPLCCWMIEDGTEAQTEVSLLERALDILATAELPGTGEQIQVAIENQYGKADPDHFGRLIGWYLPETGAEMAVLIAEEFPPQLIKAVADGRIIRPSHGLWLVEASGYMVDGRPAVHYATVACSLERMIRIDRERAFHRGRSAGGGSYEEADQRAAALFDHIVQTNSGNLAPAIQHSPQVKGFYRRLRDNGDTCHISLFVGTNRISVGSGYLKAGQDDETLERLVSANAEAHVTPEPDQRPLRGSWWHLLRGLGRDTPPEQWPDRLGDDVEAAFNEVKSAVDAHQRALKAAIAGPPVE